MTRKSGSMRKNRRSEPVAQGLRLPADGKVLLVGYKAADLSADILREGVTCHVLDIYHQHAIEKVFPGATVVCSPRLPEGLWDLVLFRTGPKLMSGELALDLLQEIRSLKPVRFELDYVGRERDRNELLDKVRDSPDRVRNFRATWQASVPGGEKLTFASYPGCFCHRRLDEGGLALAEVVTRQILGGVVPPSKDGRLRILDMGCGCGLVGLLIAARMKAPDAAALVSSVDLVMVDSHTRAVEAARENARQLGVDAKVYLADDGLASAPETEPFDVFVGNPPYYSDYRIAEVFLDTARRTLKPDGVCYTVVKNAANLQPVQERYFPAVEVLPRRNYAVLKSPACGR